MSTKKDSKTNIFTLAFDAALNQCGIKKAELSRKTGIQQGRLGEYAYGKMEPGLDVIGRIAGGFGLTLSQFFALIEPDTEKPQGQAGLEKELLLENRELRKELERYKLAEENGAGAALSEHWRAMPAPDADTAEE